MMQNAYTQLKQFSTLVADSGDIAAITTYLPQDTTTNPSLILQAAQLPQYAQLVADVAKNPSARSNPYIPFTVAIVKQLLAVIPGRVSVEVDARLSFDTQASVRYAQEIAQQFASAGVDVKRLLIKIAATWEGIEAANILQKNGINCNLTLLFSLTQAAACADAGVRLISPFVGRITDWHKAQQGVEGFIAEQDPGVQSVQKIYDYYKQHRYDTEIMAASFRNIEQIRALAGCDLLTIAPALLAQLKQDTRAVRPMLNAQVQQTKQDRLDSTQATFRWYFNEDAMATEKLAEGIRIFASAMRQLHTLFAR